MSAPHLAPTGCTPADLPALRSAARHIRGHRHDAALATLRATHDAGDWHTRAALDAPLALLGRGYADAALTVLDAELQRVEGRL